MKITLPRLSEAGPSKVSVTATQTTPRRRFKPSHQLSSSSSNHPPSIDLISPPCPLSNLRAVYYAPLFPSLHLLPSRSTTHHPYSLSEFPRLDSPTSLSDPTRFRLHKLKQKLHAQDLQWRLHRYRVDAFNQDFWSRTNTAFLRARDDYVQSLPPRAKGEEDEPIDLSEFYRMHLDSTKGIYAKYNRELWIATAGLLWPAVKAAAREWRWKWEVWKAGQATPV